MKSAQDIAETALQELDLSSSTQRITSCQAKKMAVRAIELWKIERGNGE